MKVRKVQYPLQGQNVIKKYKTVWDVSFFSSSKLRLSIHDHAKKSVKSLKLLVGVTLKVKYHF